MKGPLFVPILELFYQAPPKRFQPYKNEIVKFFVNELSEVKKLSNSHLRLLGFKPLDCLKDYHNLRPSTFIFPTDEEIIGSTRIFIALHKSMLRLRRFALAFHGSSTHPQLVALVAQDEITTASGQVEPPGMHMIYLPYSDDIRLIEEDAVDDNAPRATDEQIKKASTLLRRIDLKNFSVCQFANPALQRHYGILQALALGEDEMPDIKDETTPDEEGMARPGNANAIQEFKNAVYGENHDQEEAESAAGRGHASGAPKKRKEMTEAASKESSSYDWEELAENGKLKDLTIAELKNYLIMHKLPVYWEERNINFQDLDSLGKVRGFEGLAAAVLILQRASGFLRFSARFRRFAVGGVPCATRGIFGRFSRQRILDSTGLFRHFLRARASVGGVRGIDSHLRVAGNVIVIFLDFSRAFPRASDRDVPIVVFHLLVATVAVVIFLGFLEIISQFSRRERFFWCGGATGDFRSVRESSAGVAGPSAADRGKRIAD